MTNTNKAADLTGLTNLHIGNRYDKNADIVDVAKLVRKDLKAAGLHCSVRIQRYSGGQSLNIEVKEIKTAELKANLSKAALAHRDSLQDVHGSRDFESCYRYMAERAATKIAERYQRSASNYYTDYYSSNFHVSAMMR